MKKYIALACLSVISSTVLGMTPNDPNDNSRQNNRREFDVFSENTGESSSNVRPRTPLTANGSGFQPINSTLPMSSQNSLFVNNIGSQQTQPRPLPANALSQANQINPIFALHQPAINQNSMQINQQIVGTQQSTNSFYQQLLFQQHVTLLQQQSTIQEKDIELAKLKNSLLKQQSTIKKKDTELTKFKNVLLNQRFSIEKIYPRDASAFLSLKGNFLNLRILFIYSSDLANLSLDDLSFPELAELIIIYELLSNNLDKINELISKTSFTLQKLKFVNFNHKKPICTIPNSVWSCKNLTSLKFFDVVIPNILEEIGKFQNLENLVLSGINLSTLPPEFGNLKNLYSLNLDENYLQTLPPEFGNLKNLHSLNLDKNYLQTLPPEFGNLKNLHNLNLDENYLQTLPPEFGNLIKLEYLHIDFGEEIEKLPAEIWNLKKLKNVSLSANCILNRFTNKDEDFEEEEFIKKLYMNDQNMDLTTLPIGIIMCKNTKKINLRNNKLPEIPDLFYKFRKLEKLDVSKNNEINSIDKINDVIFGLPRLKSLILSAEIREIPGIKAINENPKDIDLIKILGKEDDGKFQVEYSKEAFSEIRNDRIRKISGKIEQANEEKSKNVLNYLHSYKNGIKISNEDLARLTEQYKDWNSMLDENINFLENIRDSIRSAETYNLDESDSDSGSDLDSD